MDWKALGNGFGPIPDSGEAASARPAVDEAARSASEAVIFPSMIDPRFLTKLRRQAEFTEAELSEFLACWEVRAVRKKEHYLREGEVCKGTAYVNKGCFRRYLIGENHKESILNFALEDWWIGDLESFFQRTPTRYFVQALEDSELLILSRENFLRACERYPKYKAFHEDKMQRSYFATLKRMPRLKQEMNDMPVMIVRHKVADFKRWKAVFDEMEEPRRRHGWTGHEVYQDAADANSITIVNHMRDLRKAKEYGGSEVLKSGMEKAGVMGPPEIIFLAEADTKLY